MDDALTLSLLGGGEQKTPTEQIHKKVMEHANLNHLRHYQHLEVHVVYQVPLRGKSVFNKLQVCGLRYRCVCNPWSALW